MRGLDVGRWWLARWALAGWVMAVSGVGVAEERVVPRIERKAVPRETLSSSGQFLAHGLGQADRAVLVTRAEEVREEVSRLLDRQERRGDSGAVRGEPGEVLVIHLWLRGDGAAGVQPRLYRVDGVPKPVLGLMMARAALAESEEFRSQLVRLLLVERMFRSQPAAMGSGGGEVLPTWLEIGVMEALNHVRAGRPSDRFATLFAQGRILGVDGILEARPGELEAAGREVHAVSACCLVMLLLDQPEGPERFRRFLEAVPGRTGSWQNLLVRQFPGLALSRHSLEKWWALQVAALATPDLLEPMTAAETDRLLERALQVRVPSEPAEEAGAVRSPVVRWIKGLMPGRAKAADGPPATSPATPPATPSPATEEMLGLEDLERVAALPRRVEVLRANQAALAALLLRAAPLHRPVIEAYQDLFGQLAQGKTKGLEVRREALAERRRQLLTTAEAVTDLLNWYEATQRRQLSGTFDRYFEWLENPPLPARPPVVDPISRSLDELEEEFSAP
jgi:hypothetical protein